MADDKRICRQVPFSPDLFPCRLVKAEIINVNGIMDYLELSGEHPLSRPFRTGKAGGCYLLNPFFIIIVKKPGLHIGHRSTVAVHDSAGDSQLFGKSQRADIQQRVCMHMNDLISILLDDPPCLHHIFQPMAWKRSGIIYPASHGVQFVSIYVFVTA